MASSECLKNISKYSKKQQTEKLYQFALQNEYAEVANLKFKKINTIRKLFNC